MTVLCWFARTLPRRKLCRLLGHTWCRTGVADRCALCGWTRQVRRAPRLQLVEPEEPLARVIPLREGRAVIADAVGGPLHVIPPDATRESLFTCEWARGRGACSRTRPACGDRRPCGARPVRATGVRCCRYTRRATTSAPSGGWSPRASERRRRPCIRPTASESCRSTGRPRRRRRTRCPEDDRVESPLPGVREPGHAAQERLQDLREGAEVDVARRSAVRPGPALRRGPSGLRAPGPGAEDADRAGDRRARPPARGGPADGGARPGPGARPGGDGDLTPGREAVWRRRCRCGCLSGSPGPRGRVCSCAFSCGRSGAGRGLRRRRATSTPSGSYCRRRRQAHSWRPTRSAATSSSAPSRCANA
jgi:hypothetical protein